MYIIGTSTLSEIIVEILQGQDKTIDGFFDDFNKESHFFGIPVLGNIEFLIKEKARFIDKPLFVAIGDNGGRAKIYTKLQNEGFTFSNVIHSQAYVEQSAVLGNGNYIGCFAYLGTRTVIGNGNVIFKGVSITHHNILGDFNFLSPNVSIGGFTAIGDMVKVGMNSVIKPYIKIQSNSSFEPLSLINE